MPGSHLPPDSWIVGVDLGGTNIAVGALPADGSRELAFHSEPTLAVEGPDAVTDRIIRVVERTIAQVTHETGATRAQFIGVGIGAPGPLDRERGVVITAPNLGWTDWPLRDKVAAATGLRATLDNDANCATLGEWWLGAARGARNAIGITIGTGIGGGIVIDGQLYHGASDVAGEMGHVTIDSTGRRCKCGNYGCLEAYASATAIADRAREALAGEEPGALWALVDGGAGRRRPVADHRAGGLPGREGGRPDRDRRRARDRALPRRGRRRVPERAQPRGGRARRWRGERGGRVVRPAARRSEAARLPAGGRRVPHRAGGARRERGGGRRSGGL
ncbi:MAG: ROK family protein, partial [Gemmatimonadaceae bacterium]|nr:ROK family protein [Gemmatimonadaceae bacterium]